MKILYIISYFLSVIGLVIVFAILLPLSWAWDKKLKEEMSEGLSTLNNIGKDHDR